MWQKWRDLFSSNVFLISFQTSSNSFLTAIFLLLLLFLFLMFLFNPKQPWIKSSVSPFSLRRESQFCHLSVRVPVSLSSQNIFWIPGNSWVNIWVCRVLLSRLSVDDSTSRRRLPPPLPNPAPYGFYAESYSSQLKVGTPQVDAVGTQTNCLIENMTYLVAFLPHSFLFFVYSSSQVQIFPQLSTHTCWLCLGFP